MRKIGKHHDRLKEILDGPEQPAVLLDPSCGLVLGTLPGQVDFSKAIPRLLPWLDADRASFLKVRPVNQSPDPERVVRQLVQIAHSGC